MCETKTNTKRSRSPADGGWKSCVNSICTTIALKCPQQIDSEVMFAILGDIAFVCNHIILPHWFAQGHSQIDSKQALEKQKLQGKVEGEPLRYKCWTSAPICLLTCRHGLSDGAWSDLRCSTCPSDKQLTLPKSQPEYFSTFRLGTFTKKPSIDHVRLGSSLGKCGPGCFRCELHLGYWLGCVRLGCFARGLPLGIFRSGTVAYGLSPGACHLECLAWSFHLET